MKVDVREVQGQQSSYMIVDELESSHWRGRNHHNGIVVNMMMKSEDPAAPTTKIVDTVALEERLRACVCMVRKKVILGFVPLFKKHFPSCSGAVVVTYYI